MMTNESETGMTYFDRSILLIFLLSAVKVFNENDPPPPTTTFLLRLEAPETASHRQRQQRRQRCQQNNLLTTGFFGLGFPASSTFRQS